MLSLRWLRRLAHEPILVTGVPGVDDKPLRDCTDDEVRAIIDYQSQLGPTKQAGSAPLLGEDWWWRTILELRREERNPLEGVGFVPLLGLAWSRLVLEAAKRSSAVGWLFQLRGRIEDRLGRDVRDDEDLESDATQVAVSNEG